VGIYSLSKKDKLHLVVMRNPHPGFGDRSKSCPCATPKPVVGETHQAALSQPSMNSLLLDGDEPLDEQFLPKKLMVIGC